MRKYVYTEQLPLPFIDVVKEEKQEPAKRVNIVCVKLARESSLLYKKSRITSPEDAYHLFKQFLGQVDREYFVVLCLDTKNQPTNINVFHIGSLNANIVSCREVFKSTILSNSNAIIVCHVHPSDDPTTSREDVDVTKRLVEAGKIIGIDVLDHIIVCDNSFVSTKRKRTNVRGVIGHGVS
ncbi:RadC family protein [Anaerobacillus sp. MEB173]|uniref:JAB domain-containing protein n=1 Tax=Anaerobacillus sp. MEB173 TaxID=3383345 RepID=UPI003F8EC0C3